MQTNGVGAAVVVTVVTVVTVVSVAVVKVDEIVLVVDDTVVADVVVVELGREKHAHAVLSLIATGSTYRMSHAAFTPEYPYPVHKMSRSHAAVQSVAFGISKYLRSA